MTNKEAIYALKSMKNASVNTFHTEALDMAIKALEAQQETGEITLNEAYAHGWTEAEAHYRELQRWIPCSERLPEDEGYYFVTLGDDGFPDRDVEIVAMQDGDWDWNPIEQVIAWKPLPEPWEGEDNE